MNSDSQNPIRVLHVINWFDQGGIENFLMNVYRNIDRNQVQFDFALTENKKGFFEEEIESLGGRYFYFDSNSKSLLNYYRSLKRIIKDNGPYAAVHSHLYYFSGIFLLIARLCGIKVRIAHSHETEKGRKPTVIRKCYEHIMRFLIKKNATHWLSCSDTAGAYVFGKDVPYQVLYNGIDLERFCYKEDSRKQIRMQLGIDNDFVVMNVGRFAPQKNHHFIVKVFKELLNEVTNSKLILIGTGSMRDEIESLLKDIGIINRVTILNNIQNTEDYYSAADAFILPSQYEGMGIVVVESQACGLYTLISDKVTREVGVTDISDFLSIEGKSSVKVWVNKLLEIKKMNIVRPKYNEEFKNTSFNIDVTVRELTDLYTTGNE